MILEEQFKLEEEMKELNIENPQFKIMWLAQQRTRKISSYKNIAINTLIKKYEIELKEKR